MYVFIYLFCYNYFFITIKLISLKMSDALTVSFISTDLLHMCLPPIDCFNLYMYMPCNGKITKKDPSHF